MDSVFNRLQGKERERRTRAALRLAEEQVAIAATKEAKVEALMSAIGSLNALRQPVLQLESGKGDGGVADAEAFASTATDQLFSLARQHGVEQELNDAVALQAQLRGAFSWGSGLEGAPLAALTCANVDASTMRCCSNAARLACPRCHLVAYCSPECAAEHRHIHSTDCGSPLAATPFVPRWEREGRMPSFVAPYGGSSFMDRLLSSSAPRQFLWGNTPAFCLVPKGDASALLPSAGAGAQPQAGEQAAGGGSSSAASGSAAAAKRSLLSLPEAHVCFAASGDLRNLIATVNGLAADHPGKVVVHLNDRDPAIAARNFLLLLLLAKEGAAAADAVIQLWYSTAITAGQRINTLKTLSWALGGGADSRTGSDLQAMPCRLLRPDGTTGEMTLEGVMRGAEEGPGVLAFDLPPPAEDGGGGGGGGANEAAAGVSLKVDFPKQAWFYLLGMMANQTGLQDLMGSRAEVIGSTDALDRADRQVTPMRPHHRVSWRNFYDLGMLLPLGAFNAHHNAPNTFLFHPLFGYTLGAGSDPLHGWPLEEVMAAGRRHQVPANDLYGALFFFLREQLTEFAGRLRSLDVELRLTAAPAEELAPALRAQGIKLDYIDVSNIADPNYCGAQRVLQDWGPLLSTQANPHATLVTLFMNYLADMPELDPTLGLPLMGAMSATKEVMLAMAQQGLTRDPFELAEMAQTAVKAGTDYSAQMQSYLQRTGALKSAAAAGLRPRAPHRIVPRRFFVPVGAPQGQLPFRGMPDEAAYLARCFSGATLLEQYVEWEGGGSGESGGTVAAVSSRGKAKPPGGGKKKKKAERRGRR